MPQIKKWKLRRELLKFTTWNKKFWSWRRKGTCMWTCNIIWTGKFWRNKSKNFLMNKKSKNTKEKVKENSLHVVQVRKSSVPQISAMKVSNLRTIEVLLPKALEWLCRLMTWSLTSTRSQFTTTLQKSMTWISPIETRTNLCPKTQVETLTTRATTSSMSHLVGRPQFKHRKGCRIRRVTIQCIWISWTMIVISLTCLRVLRHWGGSQWLSVKSLRRQTQLGLSSSHATISHAAQSNDRLYNFYVLF